MAYFDKYGVEFSDERRTLVKCPEDYKGEYVIPDGVTCISSDAFMGCAGLTSISIPNSVAQIGRWAFAGCTSLKSIVIPNRVRWIDDSTFAYCSNLMSVSLPDSITTIGYDAFRECSSLTRIEIPNSVTNIGNSAFQEVPNVSCTNLAEVPFGVGSKCVNGHVEGCLVYSDAAKVSLVACATSAEGVIRIPDSVKTIGERAFAHCVNLTNVIIPNSVENIGREAFTCCSNLTNLEIPNGVFKIGGNAFFDVPNIIYNGSATGLPRETWGAKCVNGYVDGWFVYSDVTKSTLVTCATSATGEIILPDSITKISDRAFEGCNHITHITIPEGVCDIGNKAFCNCNSLTEITLPGSVAGIGLWAFDECTNLHKIYVPQGEYTRFCQLYGLRNFTDIIRVIPEQKLENINQRDLQEQTQLQFQQLQEMLQDSILFFDTETTGTPRNYKAPVTDSYNWPRLVQLAWIMADKDGNILKRKSVIIKPDGFSIPADATAVHGITTERAQKEGLPLREVLEEFATDLSLAEQIVGHNIEFDKNIVGAELYRLGMDYAQLMDKPNICTMKSSTDYCAIPNPNGYLGYKWPSLQELYYKLFNRNYDDAHDALADITATKECFFELRKRGVI